MAEVGYFIRMRGRVSGPYDVPSLRVMAQRGSLPRFYEVSRDGLRWSAAGDVAELFQPDGLASDRPLPIPPPIPTGAPGFAAAPPAVPADDLSALSQVVGGAGAPPDDPIQKYFYAHAGVTGGPAPLGLLRMLARNRHLSANDPVWPEGRPPQSAVAARAVPGLGPSFDAAGQGGGAGRKVALILTCLALLAIPVAIVLYLRYYPPNAVDPAAPPATQEAGAE